MPGPRSSWVRSDGAPRRPARRPGPRLGVSILVMGLAVVLFIGSVVIIVVGFANKISSGQTLAVPGTSAVQLNSGGYVVFLEYTAVPSTGAPPPTVAEANVTVTGPTGQTVTLTTLSSPETLTRDHTSYSGVLTFTASTTGMYTIRIIAPAPGQAVVLPSLTQYLHSVIGWAIAAALAIPLWLAGLVMLIVGIVRRSRAGRLPAPYY